MGAGGAVAYIGPPEGWSGFEEAAANEIDKYDLPNPAQVISREAGTCGILTMPGDYAPLSKNGSPKYKRRMSPTMGHPNITTPKNTLKEGTVKRQTGDTGTWIYYGQSIGIWLIIITFTIILFSVFCDNFPKLWTKRYTGSGRGRVGEFVGIYAMSSVLSFLATGASLYSFMIVIGPISGLRLHDILVKSTFTAPMSFFEAIDSSVILNRFSQDMNLIDMMLPSYAFESALMAVSWLASLILVCIGAAWVGIIPAVIIGLFLIQRYYLRTSRQIRLLDLENRSPLYQLFTETTEGLETIR